MKKKRNAPGMMTIEEVKLEGGITIPITLIKESGIFFAEHFQTFEGENITHNDHERWEDKDLDKVRAKIKAWHLEKVKLKWEPIIVLWPGGTGFHNSVNKVLGSGFERMMRAKKLSSDSYEWRSWAYKKPNSDFLYDHDLEVYEPSGTTGEPHGWQNEPDPVILAYTPARWTSLLQLRKMEEALRDRLEEILKADVAHMDLFFNKIQSAGLLAFTGAKPKEKS